MPSSSPLTYLLLLLGAGTVLAQGPAKRSDQEVPYQMLAPLMDILPAGAMLKKVSVPIFNKKKERTALLESSLVNIVSEEEITGEKIALRYFLSNEEMIRMDMGAANFALKSGILRAKEVITLSGEQIRGRGTGGVFHLESRSGFVRGPVSTLFTVPPEEAAAKESGTKQTPPPLARPDIAGLSERFVAPEELTGAERRKIDELLKARSKSIRLNHASTRAFITEARQHSDGATSICKRFFNRVNERNLLAKVATTGTPPARFELAGGEILVTSGGGMFLDPERGHISYLRDVEVIEKRFNMTCSGQLWVFFPPRDLSKVISSRAKEQAEGDARPDNAPPAQDNFEDVFDPELFVASGGVRIVQQDPSGKNPPVIATAETAIYNRKTGDIVLQGGTPKLMQGLNSLTAGTPDLYLRLYKSGDFYAEEGLWTTIGDLAALEKARADRATSKANPAEADDVLAGDQKAPTPAVVEEDAVDEKAKDEELKIVKVTCEGGIYFDAKDGHIVYLKDVQIVHPQFTIGAKEEIKVFLERKSEAREKELGGLESFSKVAHVVASGGVTLLRNDPAGERAPITATAQHAIFNVESADILLKDGTPTIRQGENALQAGKPDLYLRFYENGSLLAEPGPWTTTGDLANIRLKKGEEKKPAQIINITCEGGLYLDSIKGEVVYLNDIVVLEPGFRLKCQDRMRITMKARDDAEEKGLEGLETFSDVDKIVALGKVVVTRFPAKREGPPLIGRSSALTYDAAKGTLVLQGGRPEFQFGKSYAKATKDGQHILVYANGSADLSKGAWDQFLDVKGADLQKLQKDRGPKKNN